MYERTFAIRAAQFTGIFSVLALQVCLSFDLDSIYLLLFTMPAFASISLFAGVLMREEK